MRTLGYMLSAAQRATASGARIFQVLDREPQITSPGNAPALPDGHGRVVAARRRLTFDGRRPPGAARHRPRDRAGRTVALVGAMGSGKTALVSLLPRLYDVSDGRGPIDGADVRSVDLASLRHAIAIVTDDPFLFSATVHDNIAYARPEATPRGGRARGRAPPRPPSSSSALPDGLRHARRRARADALGRPAPADRDRPRDPRRPADPRSSTTRPRRSTPRPSRRSSWRSAR